jgi:hypothetical protein
VSPALVVHTFNSRPQKTEVGGSGVQDQLGLHSEILSQKERMKDMKKGEKKRMKD